MEEEKTTETTAEVTDNAADYIAEIERLKRETVPAIDYTKLKNENARLIKSLANGETVATEPKKAPDLAQLRKNVFNKEHQSNLEYWENVLALRDAVIEAGEPDPFLPCGHKIVPTRDDAEAAQRVADTVRECIEYAEGDSQLFTNELMRRTVDVSMRPRRK